LPEPPRRGGLLAAAARLPRASRPLGRGGDRAAAKPPPAPRRRHRRPAGAPRPRVFTHSRRRLPAPPRETNPSRLDGHAPAAGTGLRLARLRGERGRQRGRRPRAAGTGGAARHPYRLESPASRHRRRRAAPGLRGRDDSVRPDAGGAGGLQRPAPVGGRALCLARRLPRARAGGSARARPGGLSSGRGHRAIGGRRREALGLFRALREDAMQDPPPPPAILIGPLATAPTAPAAAGATWPNVLHTRIADVARLMGPPPWSTLPIVDE